MYVSKFEMQKQCENTYFSTPIKIFTELRILCVNLQSQTTQKICSYNLLHFKNKTKILERCQ